MEGVGWHHINVRDGKRWSTAEGYLLPALSRQNITVSEDSHAMEVLFSGERCTGVEYISKVRHRRSHAKQEVIVSLGAIESPKLLMLSGIGDPAHLAEFGIEAINPLPGVGQNFHNHVLTGVINECKDPV